MPCAVGRKRVSSVKCCYERKKQEDILWQVVKNVGGMLTEEVWRQVNHKQNVIMNCLRKEKIIHVLSVNKRVNFGMKKGKLIKEVCAHNGVQLFDRRMGASILDKNKEKRTRRRE